MTHEYIVCPSHLSTCKSPPLHSSLQAGIHPELPDLSPDDQAAANAASSAASSPTTTNHSSSTTTTTRPNGVGLTASQKASEARQAVHAAANEAREWRLKASMLEQQLHRMESLHQVKMQRCFFEDAYLST